MIFDSLISDILHDNQPLNNIWFAGDFHPPVECSYQVNFPRLELVLAGQYVNKMEDHNRKVVQRIATTGDALYIPPNCWNKPYWNNDCLVLSILFGRRQMGLSLVCKKHGSERFDDVKKHSIQTRSGFAIDNILEALNALAREPNKQPMDALLLKALLGYSKNMLLSSEVASHCRVTDLYQGICIYIQENFHRPINRDSIANRFNMSANHLSRMFHQQGHMTLASYITWVRLERAKFMLKRYNLRLSEVSSRCGFRDVNYFCRVFKKRTGKTPSQYRTTY